MAQAIPPELLEINPATGVAKRWGDASSVHSPTMLSKFNARETDVLIATPAKCGTTWMQNILHQLKTQGDDNFETIFQVVPWLEVVRDKSEEEALEDYEKMSNPRIFKTHCTYYQTPLDNNPKIILSTRDPRDVAVSFYHHTQDIQEFAEIKQYYHGIGMDEFLDKWLDFAAWFRAMEQWWPHRNDSNVLLLRYEDMKSDLSSCLDKICEFLGWTKLCDLSEEKQTEILRLCSFEWMKENVSKFNRFSKEKPPTFKPDGFIRRGKVGDHAQELSEEQQKRIIDKAKATLPPECLEFVGISAD